VELVYARECFEWALVVRFRLREISPVWLPAFRLASLPVLVRVSVQALALPLLQPAAALVH
jgi:hypothetical protein